MLSVLSEEFKTLYKGWVAALADNPSMELDQVRRMFEHLGDVTAELGGVDYVEVTADSMPALWATPRGRAQDCVVLCTHGGGYVTGSMYTHRNKAHSHFATAISCRARIVNYRRAPEHVHSGRSTTTSPATAGCSTRASSCSTSRSPAIRAGARPCCGHASAACRCRPPPCRCRRGSTWGATGKSFVCNGEKDVLV
ncbi:MAG TPA: alpha/beta hydrolase fold domain-containing protein [Bradyrhizobium sp.]|nr:alpha/beta hydrolase fold domain-containing protein [Bradyrhizobium sp.]